MCIYRLTNNASRFIVVFPVDIGSWLQRIALRADNKVIGYCKTMMLSEYRVECDHFGGPLDLLLYLVRRNEISVLDFKIATITEQFLEYLEVLEFLDFELVGEFVVTASALLEIKSREVLPDVQEQQQEELIEEQDSNSELVAQLLNYKRYKEAAEALDVQAANWQERYPRLANDRPEVSKDPAADRIKEVELWDLVSALSRVLQKKQTEKTSRIQYDDTPIAVHSERIAQRVRSEGKVAFSAFFEKTNLRSRIVGVFLAILELLRHHGFQAQQPADYGEIWILPPKDEQKQS